MPGRSGNFTLERQISKKDSFGSFLVTSPRYLQDLKGKQIETMENAQEILEEETKQDRVVVDCAYVNRHTHRHEQPAVNLSVIRDVPELLWQVSS